ncbi:MAG: hypothetical protein HY270_18320 [Deltaproteobacteria bacterium]|nr:hypothetical protein [Deltaproteobacteria bacterium]
MSKTSFATCLIASGVFGVLTLATVAKSAAATPTPAPKEQAVKCAKGCLANLKGCMVAAHGADKTCRAACPQVPQNCGKHQPQHDTPQCLAVQQAASVCLGPCRDARTEASVACYDDLAGCLVDCGVSPAPPTPTATAP